MTTKRVVIDYDEQDGPGGEPLDLAAYLVNELDNTGIVAEVLDARPEGAIIEFIDGEEQ